jgi:triphosphatase
VVAPESARQSKEVELKLEVDPADVARIASHPALEASLTPPQERDLISTYFDTTDFALRDARVFLRVRESGGRYVQTVKTAKSDTEFLERFEWEQEIAGSAPDPDAVEGTALAPLLTPELRASLQLLFETRIRRKTYLLERGGSEIEVAIDQGEIVAAPRRRQISELELELKRGETAELFRLARVLAETVPLRLAVKTKAERGYELLEDGKHEVEKAAEIDIGPNMPSGDAFRAIAQSCLRQIIANELAMCGGHAEALHQMRIGLRRLRAAISIFADVIADTDLDKIKAELKWITQELGPARDLDVFAADVLQPLLLAHPDDAEIALTHRDFEARRAAAYARAAGSVRSDRFRHAALDLVEWVEVGPWTVENDAERATLRTRPIAERARHELARLRKQIKSRGADLRHQSVRQRHKLRIRSKRLRYATEFFASTFPGEKSARRRAEALSALKNLQGALGGLNDLATRHTLIADGTEGQAAESERAAPESERAAPASRLRPTGINAGTLLLAAEQAFARFAQAKAFWKP